MSVYFKLIINIPSGDARFCDFLKSESITWLHNHSSWKDLFNEDTFLVFPVSFLLWLLLFIVCNPFLTNEDNSTDTVFSRQK